MQLGRLWLRLGTHSLLLALLIMAGALAPATALDQGNVSSNHFCDNITARGDHIDSQISSIQSEERAEWQQQSGRLSVMISQQQSSRNQLTKAVDIQRAHNIAALRRHASNPQQRVAIDTYQRTQAQAIAQRRKTVNQANDNFTAAVKRFVADRQAAQAGQIEALRIAIDDTVKSAESECATGVDDAVVAHDFANSILSIRLTYQAQRKNDTLIVAQLAALNTTRQSAVTSANQLYNSTMNLARQPLQAALHD